MRSAVGLAACVVVACATSPNSVGGRADAGPDGSKIGVSLDAGDASTGEPRTCAEAEATKSYVGCDFWPTPVTNHVWSIFDFAVVVANASDTPAEIAIDKGATHLADGVVEPRSLQKFYLPWDPVLKGEEFAICGGWAAGTETLRAPDGAFHLTSTSPVTVYQFNALEYQGAGGPPGKSWSACPGNQICPDFGSPLGCYSYSNDASLLLPSTAMTGAYRITSQRGWSEGKVPPYLAITGTENGTHVTFQVGKGGAVQAGGGVTAASEGDVIQLDIERGEVVELFATPESDLSGSVLSATKPVQVITGMPCVFQPFDVNTPACDHIEETVFPAETWGKHYFVTRPTGPNGDAPGHIVRLFGNVDGTGLVYAPAKPSGAPDSLDAGEVVDLGIVGMDFEITGTHELAIGVFQLSGQLADSSPGLGPRLGDPSQSIVTAVEQYRTEYVFLAPDDYITSFVDVIAPAAAEVVLDGTAISSPGDPLANGYTIRRLHLANSATGAHLLTSDVPVGIQVMGYGFYTSYQYPGGSNLKVIAPPPLIK